MSNRLTLESIEVLDAIDRKGSFAAAAAALYRVPSAVTYNVQKLEEDLGVTLFRKEGRRSVLTPAGKVLLNQGRELLDAAERLVETTRQIDSGWESCLNIAVDSVFEFEVIYPLLERFYQIKPDIEVNLYEEVLGGAWESIHEGRADLVLGAPGPVSQPQGLKVAHMASVEWQFAVSRNHPLTLIGHPLTEADVQQYRAVVVRDSSRQLPPLTRRVFDKQPVLSVPTLGHKITAQTLGLGVGFLPVNRVGGLIASGDLVVLDVEQMVEPSELYLAWKAGSSGRALRWFIERLTAE